MSADDNIMNGLKVIGIDESKQWDEIVKSFKKHDIYWSSGYVKAFKIHGDGEPLLFYYQDNKVRGINVVMKRDIACDGHFRGIVEKDKYFDFSTPYGYGGWLIEGGDSLSLFAMYDTWCKQNGIISEFVRFHPILRNHESISSYYLIVPLGLTVAMELTSPELIWNNITSKNRNMIRKAKKNGIKIYNGRCPEIFETFRGLYNKTMDKDNAKDYYYFEPEFYESICEELPENVQIFYAMLGGKIVAASIILFVNGMMTYHLSGAEREYMNLAPSNLLLYKAALWGSENGYRLFYLGGGVGSEEDSLFKFKNSFYKGDLHRFYIGKRIIDKEKYEKLTNMRTGLLDNGYFPKYRS